MLHTLSPTRLFFILFLAIHCSGYAQDKTDSLQQKRDVLPEVIISSTPVTDELKRIPAAVNIISSADLQRGDQVSIANELNKNPGILMQQGALNLSRITIRGLGARSQFSTNRIKAYIEGIPLTSGEGESSLEDIDLEIIDRIEVIKGPNSSIYGAGLGGVINISVLKPISNEVSTYGLTGSYGLFKSGVTAGLASAKTSGLISYNHLEQDGFRNNSGYNRNTLTLHTQTQVGRHTRLTLFGNYTNLKAYIPSSLNEEDFINSPEKAAFTWAQARGFESYDKALGGISVNHRFSDQLQNTNSIFGSYRDGYEPRPFDIMDEKQWAIGARTLFNYNPDYLPVKTAFGAEYLNEDYRFSLFENLYRSNEGRGSVQGDQFSEIEQDRSYLNVFAQINYQITNALKAEAGLSFNTTRYTLDDKMPEQGTDRSGSYRYDNQWSPRLGLSWEAIEEKFIYATVSHGFSIPTVAETLTPEGAINTELNAETGTNYELGFKAGWLDKRLYTELALYSIQVDNLIVAERIAEDRFVGRNAGKTDHNGIEFLVNYRQDLNADWDLRPYGALTFNFYEFDRFTDEGEDFSGNDLTGIPDKVINLGLDIQNNAFKFNINYRHTGRIPLNDENSLYSDSYNLVNIRSDYRFSLLNKLETTVYAGINNLFDANYATQILPNAVGFGGSAPRYYYPGDPANFYLGLNLRLN